MNQRTENLKQSIRNVTDFPKPGISFKDITPLLSDPSIFQSAIDALIQTVKGQKIDKVIGLDARGFLFATPIALQLNAGFVPIRKKGKLPWLTHEKAYSLEYGQNTVEIHQDAIKKGENVLLIDDLLATGGTANAAIQLIDKLGGNIIAASFLIELTELKGRDLLGNTPIHSIIKY